MHLGRARDAQSAARLSRKKPMATYKLTVNDVVRSVEVRTGDQPLLYVLRNQLGLTGARFGCGLGQCGSCAVLLDGDAVRSCQIPVAAAAGRKVTTTEGLGRADKPHPVQAAFIAEQATQCGYCATGMVMTSVALLARNPNASLEQVQTALAGNLCRCGAHQRILRAVMRAAGRAPA
jgi:nicotinate dehydrogenase subunit A